MLTLRSIVLAYHSQMARFFCLPNYTNLLYNAATCEKMCQMSQNQYIKNTAYICGEVPRIIVVIIFMCATFIQVYLEETKYFCVPPWMQY